MRFFILIAIVALLWGGGQNLHTWLTNRAPLETSLAEYAATKPQSLWLKLDNCEVDVIEGVYFSKFGVQSANEVYLPVRPSGGGDGSVHVVFQTADPAIMEFVKSENLPEEQIVEMAEKLILQNARREISGLVRTGVEMKTSDRRKLRENLEGLVNDFVVVKEGEKPDVLKALTLLLGGIALGGVFLFTGRKKPSGLLPPGVPPPPTPSRPPPLPPSR